MFLLEKSPGLSQAPGDFSYQDYGINKPVNKASDSILYTPARRLGLIFHFAAIVLLTAASAWGLWQAAHASIRPTFLLYLLPALLAIAAVFVLLYSAYALRNAFYALERDGIRLRWGLRYEDIPMTSVEWVYAASELVERVPLPRLRWPGAVLGIRRVPEGEVEFLASDTRSLILIGAEKRVYAISPADPQGFLNTFQRFTEIGSLSPLAARSLYPTFLIGDVWRSRAARLLLLSGGLFSLALVIWVSLAAPAYEGIHMGFHPDGSPGDLVPAVRLLLLPVINTFIFLGDVFLGLFFFRREDSHFLAYLMWGSGALSPLLFLAAVFFILQSS